MSPKPSKTNSPSSNQETPWIWSESKIESPSLKKDYTILDGKIVGEEGLLIKETKDGILVETFPLTEESIDAAAKKNDILVGKWLIFRPRSEIDDIWTIISRETKKGTLGVSAKVSTKHQEKEEHVICVYTYDYFDSEDVLRVREELRVLGIREQIYYKPDIYTHLGIYSGTCTIHPWKYRS